MNRQRAECKISELAAKLITILLVAGLLLSNASLSFAEFDSSGEFTSIAKQMFSASVTIPEFTDTDFDGIPDSWEQQYGLDLNDPDDADSDNDNDGITNLEEYRLSTNPIVSNSGIVASIIADKTTGPQPLDVRLTAQVEDDKDKDDDDIVKYEWDFDGNGTYDYSSRSPLVIYKFTTSGQNNVKLRVTNRRGEVGITTKTINVEKAPNSPTAITNPTLIDTTIPKPWIFSGARSDDIILYQWDLDGDGEYDFVSDKSPSVLHTYRDVKRRSFNAHFKVTNSAGLSDAGVTGVNIDSLPWYNLDTNQGKARPKIVFSGGYVIRCRAGEEILLSGYGVPVAGNDFGFAKRLEWDFENDGIYDWTTTLANDTWTGDTNGTASVTHTYGAPGIYRPTLRVTTDANVTATDHILVIVEDSARPNKPRAVAKADYGALNNVASVTGNIPLEVTFSHVNSSGGRIDKYEWDFDGDKIFDYSTSVNNPRGVNAPVFTYTMPGYYLATLRVTDSNGLTDTAYVPVFVTIPASYTNSAHASAIIRPREGQIISGNNVTLSCNIFPDDVTVDDVIFQYSADGSQWSNIPEQARLRAAYMVRWNTRNISDGNYLVRAIVRGEDSEDFLPVSVIIGNRRSFNEIEIDEDDSTGAYRKKVKINPNRHNGIILSDGVRIEIPIGTIEDNNSMPEFSATRVAESAGVGGAIDLQIQGPNSFTKDITITIPYPDENNDGIVDGTGRSENDIVVLWRNAKGEWEPLYDSLVYPDENYVVGRLNHFTLFGAGFFAGAGGIFGAGGASAEEGGGVSFCFIATAAYGSADAEDVMILRNFRDKFLLNDPLGEKFVSYYYKYSPKLADYIKDRPALKKITRLALKPVVKFAEWKLGVGATFMAPRKGFDKSNPYNSRVRGEQNASE